MNSGLFAANQWKPAHGESFKSTSPASGEILWQGASATATDVNEAFLSARKAFASWSQTTLEERFELARKFASIVQEHSAELAATISLEMGKPLWEANTEAGAVAGKIELAIDALQNRRSTSTSTIGSHRAVTRYKPHGVLGVLGPFNLPAHLPNGHIVPAILAGNTVVFKPSELTPKVGELMVKYWEAAGLPSGLINLVQGGRETGEALVDHLELDGVLFTGSSRAGIAINRKLAETPQKIVALEMGGNNPLIVHQCQDLRAAAYHTLLSAFITSGQRCTCARRLFLIEGSESNAFLTELQKWMERTRVGLPDESPEPFLGPVVNAATGQRLLEVQKRLVSMGAKSIVQMEQQKNCPALVSPGLIDVTDVEGLEDEEWFGPMLQVYRVSDFDAAIEGANRTKYGLSAGLLSDNAALYEQFIQQIRAGVVNWNRQTTGASGRLPFGGCGLSGNHRPSGYFAADYCSYPVASLESETADLPDDFPQGIAAS